MGASEETFGAAVTRSLSKETQRALTWEHFLHGEILAQCEPRCPDEARGNYRTTVQGSSAGLSSFARTRWTPCSRSSTQNNLYRGEEHRRRLQSSRGCNASTNTRNNAREQSLFYGANAHGSAARFRNTVLGTLVQNLSEGQDVDQAVRNFEAKVAPQNYKRTTAVITPTW